MKKRIIAGMLALCLAMSLPAGALATTTPSATPAATVQETEPDAAAPESTAPASSDAAASSDASDAAASDANAASDAATDAAPSDAASSDAPADPSSDAASSAASDATTGVEGDTSAASSAATDAAPSDAAASDAASSDDATAPDAAAEITYTATADGITVTATAAAGVLPDGVTMLAARITGEDETAAVAAQLDEQGVACDGFLPLDISFINNVDGAEVEPSGPVSVTIELTDTAALADADLSTLAVRHLVEDETGSVTGVETVAAVNPADGEGTVTVPAAAQPMTLSLDEESTTEPAATGIVAEFTVDSFSTFTLTWSSWPSTSNQVTVHHVDENGNELTTTGATSQNLDSGDSVTLADYQATINGYTYQEARLSSVSGQRLTEYRASRSGTWWEPTWTYQYKLNNGDWTDTNARDIYLIYKQDATEPDPEPSVDKSLTHDKTVTKNSDGTYDLELTVSGAIGTEENKAKLDVIFVLDRSGSMARRLDGDHNAYQWNDQRMKAATDAIKSLTQSLDENTKIDAQYAVITFGSRSYDQTDWLTSANAVSNALPGSRWNSGPYSQGTNYEAGLKDAQTKLSSARSDATKIVIFISDGDPTYYYEGNGSQLGGSGNSYSSTAMSHAQTVVGQLTGCDYFYTVGVGPRDNYSKLEYLTNPKASGSPNTSVTLPQGMATGNFAGTDSASLNNAFSQMEGEITQLLCSNVTISDKLSENVTPVLTTGTDGTQTPKKLVVTVLDEDGKEVVTPDISVSLPATDKNSATTLTATYSNGTITLDFPDDYVLEANWVYKVTMTIDATEKAYENYRDNGNTYPDSPDKNTGTHANEKGLYSNDNDNATVTYTFNGNSTTEKYPKPVIQINPGKLVITKTVSGLTDDPSNNDNAFDQLKNTLSFKVTLGTEEKTIQFKDFTLDEKTGNYSYTIDGLSPSTTYKVEEQNETVDGYTVTTTKTGDNGSIQKGQTATAAFTNTYAVAEKTLTVTKQVAGNMSSKDDVFTFTLTLKDKDNELYTTTLKATTTDTNNNTGKPVVDNNATLTYVEQSRAYTFTLSAQDTIAITIPTGYSYTLTETDAKGYTSTTVTPTDESAVVKEKVVTGTLSDDTTVTYTNTKNIVTPTGLTHNNTPYLVMIGAAGLVMLMGAGTAVRRRRRGE